MRFLCAGALTKLENSSTLIKPNFMQRKEGGCMNVTRDSKLDKDDEKKANDELRLLYTSALSEIASFRQQHWNVTNYGVLMYAAIVSLGSLKGFNLTKIELGALFLLNIVVVVAGWLLIGDISAALRLRRERLSAVRGYFSKEFTTAWNVTLSPQEFKMEKNRDIAYLCFFRGIFFTGFIVTMDLLLRQIASL